MENPDPWWPLLGVLIGGMMGGGGIILRDYLMHRKERKALAAVINAEIRSIIEITERRGHENHFRSFLEHWEKGQWLDKRPTIVGLRSMDDARIDPVADANLDKLGLLGPGLAADIIQFYTMMKGIRADLVSISTEPDLEQCKKLLKEDFDLWEEAKSLGVSLQNRLDNI
jgi:hypothetical protein